MSRVLVVGGGAAGMMAAITAAGNGHEVHLFEKNEKLGKKLFITGKGRCNITNACDMEVLFENIVSNPKFLYSAFYGFHNYDMMDFLEKHGLKLKVERGGRVFPESDKSSDVIRVLQNELKHLGVSVHLKSRVTEILSADGAVYGIALNKEKIEGNAVIITTGGISYQSTGSTGDGYAFAKKLGHSVSALAPGLVPFTVKEEWIRELQGLSLKNVRITIRGQTKQKEYYTDFGEMLFTHFGVSGPVIISASSHVTKELLKEELLLTIDLKPALTFEQLDARLLREFDEARNKQVKNVLGTLLPSRLLPVMNSYMGISPEKKVNEIEKEERMHMVRCLKAFTMTLTGFRDYNEAIITRGGISVKEINPSTMESKLVKGLYFAGEVLDLDALTGGFNLQIAWSTAYAAGNSIAWA